MNRCQILNIFTYCDYSLKIYSETLDNCWSWRFERLSVLKVKVEISSCVQQIFKIKIFCLCCDVEVCLQLFPKAQMQHKSEWCWVIGVTCVFVYQRCWWADPAWTPFWGKFQRRSGRTSDWLGPNACRPRQYFPSPGKRRSSSVYSIEPRTNTCLKLNIIPFRKEDSLQNCCLSLIWLSLCLLNLINQQVSVTSSFTASFLRLFQELSDMLIKWKLSLIIRLINTLKWKTILKPVLMWVSNRVFQHSRRPEWSLWVFRRINSDPCLFKTFFMLVPTCCMSLMASWALSRFRQARITRAPFLARCRAVALPMPVLPPAAQTVVQSHIKAATWWGQILEVCSQHLVSYWTISVGFNFRLNTFMTLSFWKTHVFPMVPIKYSQYRCPTRFNFWTSFVSMMTPFYMPYFGFCKSTVWFRHISVIIKHSLILNYDKN